VIRSRRQVDQLTNDERCFLFTGDTTQKNSAHLCSHKGTWGTCPLKRSQMIIVSYPKWCQNEPKHFIITQKLKTFLKAGTAPSPDPSPPDTPPFKCPLYIEMLAIRQRRQLQPRASIAIDFAYFLTQLVLLLFYRKFFFSYHAPF